MELVESERSHESPSLCLNCPLQSEESFKCIEGKCYASYANGWLLASELSPWARGGSAKYLWSEEELAGAISYVEYGQGLPLD